MSQTADAISADNLGHRLEIANPHDELGRLGKSFNRLLDRLEASFEVQRRFMSDASHEFRTPVSIARTAAQVTLERKDRSDAEYRDALSVIEGQLQRMGRLVEDMFLLATADSGALHLQHEQFYMEEVISESVAAARLLAARKQISIDAGPFEELPCYGDLARLRQAIMILLDNAIKYSPPNSKIEVQATSRDGQLQIDILDHGFGIAPEDRDRIFERFYRPDNSRTRGSENSGGAGLGLPIACRIAEAHSGRLDLIHTSPAGSHFRFTLSV
jgi:signal transduction histidine kinase